MFNGKVGGKNS